VERGGRGRLEKISTHCLEWGRGSSGEETKKRTEENERNEETPFI